MNRHTVFVAGKHFVLLSDDKEKYVQKLAAEVGDAITKISMENPTIDRRAAAILCALDYADDKHKEAARNKSLSERAQPLIAQADRQSKQLKEQSEKLAEKDALIAAVKKDCADKIAEKDAEIAKLNKELKELREAFEKSTRILDGPGMVKTEVPVKPQNNQNHKTHKGYKPTRQYSLFDDDSK